MRGVEIRINFARANITAAIFGEEFADFDVSEVLRDAEALGHYDYQDGIGIASPPLLFKDEPLLLRAWKIGWYDQDSLSQYIGEG